MSNSKKSLFGIIGNAVGRTVKEVGAELVRRVQSGAEAYERKLDQIFSSDQAVTAQVVDQVRRLSEAPPANAAQPAAAPPPASVTAIVTPEIESRTATPGAIETAQKPVVAKKAPPGGMRYCACACGNFTADRSDRPFTYACFKRVTDGGRKPGMEVVDRLGNPLPEPLPFPRPRDFRPRQIAAPRREQQTIETATPAPKRPAILGARRCAKGEQCVDVNPAKEGAVFQPRHEGQTNCPACHRKAHEPPPIDRVATIAKLVELTGRQAAEFERCTDGELAGSLRKAHINKSDEAQRARRQNSGKGGYKPNPIVETKNGLQAAFDALPGVRGGSAWTVKFQENVIHVRRSPKNGAIPGAIVFQRVPVSGKYVDIDGFSASLAKAHEIAKAAEAEAAQKAAAKKVAETIAAQKRQAEEDAKAEAAAAHERELVAKWAPVVEALIVAAAAAPKWETEVEGAVLSAFVEHRDDCRVRATVLTAEAEESFSYTSEHLKGLKPPPPKAKKGEDGGKEGKKGKGNKKNGGKGKK